MSDSSDNDSVTGEHSTFDGIKVIIKSYLFSGGSKCSGTDIRRDYFEETGENLDKVIREKFAMTFYQFVQQIPDVCKVTQQVNGELILERTANKELAYLDEIKKRDPKRTRKLRNPKTNSNRDQGYKSRQSFNGNRRIFNNSKNTNQVGTMNKHNNSEMSVPLRRSAAISATFAQPRPNRPMPMMNQNARLTNSPVEENEIQLKMLTDCKNHIKEILLLNGGKCAEAKLDKDFYRATQCSFDSMAIDCGFKSNFELLQQMNDVCIVKKDSKCGLLVEIQPSLHSEQAINIISQEKHQFQTSSHPPVIVSDKTHHMNIEKPNSTIRGCACKEIFNHDFHDFYDSSSSNTSEKSHDGATLSTSKNVAGLTDYVVDVLRIPNSRLKVADQRNPFEIRFLKVNSPNNFAFQFNLKMLDKIMERMLLHYSTRKNLQIRLVLPGMSVAARINDRWFRAEVLYVDKFNVCVKLIDFNELKHVKPECLRYLKKSFFLASKMCAVGSLFNVKPRNNWSSFDDQPIRAFGDELKENSQIYAIVEEVKEDKIALSLYRDCCQKLNINKLIGDICNLNPILLFHLGQKYALE